MFYLAGLAMVWLMAVPPSQTVYKKIVIRRNKLGINSIF